MAGQTVMYVFTLIIVLAISHLLMDTEHAQRVEWCQSKDERGFVISYQKKKDTEKKNGVPPLWKESLPPATQPTICTCETRN